MIRSKPVAVVPWTLASSYSMFDLIAPVSAPQPEQFLAGVQHPLAPELLQAVRGHGNQPVGLWKIVNQLAQARRPKDRDERRCLCLRFLGAARELIRAGLLFRHDGLIALTDFAITPKPRLERCLPASVEGATSKSSVSGPSQEVTTAATLDRQNLSLSW